MRILALSNIFPPGYIGGYELGAYELLSSLASRGHQIRVISSDYLNEAPVFDGPSMEVHRTLDWLTLKHNRWPEPRQTERAVYLNSANIRRLSTEIQIFQPDLIISFNLLGLGAVSLTQFIDRCGIPSILYLMDNVFAPIDANDPLLHSYTSVFGNLRYDCDPVTVSMSRNLQSEMAAVPGLLSNDVRIVPGWVHKVQPDRKPKPSRRETKFVFSSRVAGHKGIGIVEMAVDAAVGRGVTDFSVDVYGQGEIQQFLQSVKARGLEDYIRYAGSLEKQQMTEKLNDYDALLLPTWEREPFGFVVSEAAAAGCIPIMTAGIGASEWFVDGVDCLKIHRDVDPLYQAMRRVIEMSPAQLCQMQVAAQRVAQQSLRFDYWAETIHDMCLELISRPKRERPDPAAIEAAFHLLGDIWLHRQQ